MQILITTKKGTVDVTELVPAVKWSGDYQQAARALDFEILSSASDRSIPVTDCPVGAGIRMLYGKETLFDGFVVSRSKNTEGGSIGLSCYDRGFYLNRNQAAYAFTSTTPEAAAAIIAKDFGFKLGSVAKTGIPVTRLFLTGTSTLYDILVTMYTLAGQKNQKKYQVGFQGAALCVTEKGPNDRTLLLEGKCNLIAATTNESIEKSVSAVAVYSADGTLLRMLEDAERIGLYGRLQEAVSQGKGQDKTEDAQKLLESGGPVQQISVDCLGNVANVTGSTAVLREPYTGLYGLFYIENDVHEWKRGQYFNKLVLNFNCLMDEKEAGSLPNADGSRTSGKGGTVWKRIPTAPS